VSGADIVVLLLYLGAVVAAGSLVGGAARSTRDFFFGGQRFSWWIIAASCIATLVGSYSFMKYSEVGFRYGLASSSTYLNDWFWMPLWMFGWLPIIYFSRVGSIPEYFMRRFGPSVRHIATGLIMLYLLAGVSYNFYTLGVVVEQLFDIPLMVGATVIGVVVGAYVTFGGQASVIMTDLVQGVFLLGVGLAIVVLGALAAGGFGDLWSNFPASHRSALPAFNTPAGYNFIGIFWNDAVVGGIAFYFFNQGMMLRFLSARSVKEGRKAIMAVILVLMPLTAIAVASAGWVGQSLSHIAGPDGAPLIDPNIDAKAIFIAVSKLLFTVPGTFGLVIAALMAALMSTVDTLINASAAIVVNDILMPMKPNATREELLRLSRYASVVVTILGLLITPAYANFDSLYTANAFLKAAIPPPVAVAVLLGAFWRGSTTIGIVVAMVSAVIITSLSFAYPQIVAPFAHGTPWDVDGDPAKQLVYMRAFLSFSVAMVIGITVSLATRAKPAEELRGLVAGSFDAARQAFKQDRLAANIGVDEQLPAAKTQSDKPILVSCTPVAEDFGVDAGGRSMIRLHASVREQLDVVPGDLVFAERPNPLWGGLRSGCFRVAEQEAGAGFAVGEYGAALLGARETTPMKIWRWM
jgi:solute:Na+ symporter, SSS family